MTRKNTSYKDWITSGIIIYFPRTNDDVEILNNARNQDDWNLEHIARGITWHTVP